MAAYPSYPQLTGSTEEWLDDIAIDRSVAGNAKARAFYTARKRRFKLRHLLTYDQVYVTYAGVPGNALATFYDTNRLLTVTLTWSGDGATYTCLFEDAPAVKFDGRYGTVDVKLVQV